MLLKPECRNTKPQKETHGTFGTFFFFGGGRTRGDQELLKSGTASNNQASHRRQKMEQEPTM